MIGESSQRRNVRPAAVVSGSAPEVDQARMSTSRTVEPATPHSAATHPTSRVNNLPGHNNT
jgi:hypothetical protein